MKRFLPLPLLLGEEMSPRSGDEVRVFGARFTGTLCLALLLILAALSSPVRADVTVYRVGKVLTMDKNDAVVNNAVVVVRDTAVAGSQVGVEQGIIAGPSQGDEIGPRLEVHPDPVGVAREVYHPRCGTSRRERAHRLVVGLASARRQPRDRGSSLRIQRKIGADLHTIVRFRHR